MPLVFFEQGRDASLASLVNRGPRADLVMHLYCNDHFPGEGDSSAEYQECDFPGYQFTVLSGQDWTVSGGVANFAEQTFVRSRSGTAQPVYGYYYTRAGEAIAAERFADGPYWVSNMKDEIAVTPNISNPAGRGAT